MGRSKNSATQGSSFVFNRYPMNALGVGVVVILILVIGIAIYFKAFAYPDWPKVYPPGVSELGSELAEDRTALESAEFNLDLAPVREGQWSSLDATRFGQFAYSHHPFCDVESVSTDYENYTAVSPMQYALSEDKVAGLQFIVLVYESPSAVQAVREISDSTSDCGRYQRPAIAWQEEIAMTLNSTVPLFESSDGKVSFGYVEEDREGSLYGYYYSAYENIVVVGYLESASIAEFEGMFDGMREVVDPLLSQSLSILED